MQTPINWTVKGCPECASKNIYQSSRNIQGVERSEAICRDCGLVIEDPMSFLAVEWHGVGNEWEEGKRQIAVLTS